VKLIDFQLVVTHVIAFLIVLWLLRRFAWDPVLRLLEERRNKIQGDLDNAAQERQEAAALAKEYEAHLRNIDAERREQIRQAVAEANATAGRIKQRAEEEARARRERAKDEVRMIEDAAKETLRRRTVDLAMLAAEKAIRERMDGEKHRELIEGFLDRLDTADESRGA